VGYFGLGGVRMFSKASNRKIQEPNKFQISNPKNVPLGSLFGISIFFFLIYLHVGSWFLDLGSWFLELNLIYSS